MEKPHDNTNAMPGEARGNIYYWKCDRPAALHGTAVPGAAQRAGDELQRRVAAMLAGRFGAAPADLRPGGGQGNHFIFRATIAEKDCIIRVE
ncbi:MAG: hypothetical protein LBM92_04040, partial [Opitutaceae bacterium]|nr:hypothetical protein [Opitutaceae bacterium]